MKNIYKIFYALLTAALMVSSTVVSSTVFADEAAKDYEYNAKNDVIFEDFNREDISDTVSGSETALAGEKPYLIVTYEALAADSAASDRISQIYKQGSSQLAKVKDGGTINIRMRAPEGDVTLSELNLGVRGIDNDSLVYAKGFDQLLNGSGEALPELTDEWQDYEISFETSYDPAADFYPKNSDSDKDTPVVGAGSPDLLGIHIFADDGETGTLDIASISFSAGTNGILNDFTGGDTVEGTAATVDTGHWWSGSAYGYIAKRNIVLNSGEITIIKEQPVGDFAYAIIEATGDVENLGVAVTEDGTTWSEAQPYDSYSVALGGKEKGFKLSYNGSSEEGVTVSRIFLTNLVVKSTERIDVSDKELDLDNAAVSDGVIDFKPTIDGYEYAGYVGSLAGFSGDVLKMDITVQEGTDLSELRLEFTDPKKICWSAPNDEGTLYTTDGKSLSETEFTPGEAKTVFIELGYSEATPCDFHVHTSGNSTGAFKLENIALVPYASDSSDPNSSGADNAVPAVEILNQSTAIVGENIKIDYTVSDNVTKAEDINVTVTAARNGNAITLSDNSFVAEEGIYSITVLAEDAAGNQGYATLQINVSLGSDRTNSDGNGVDSSNLAVGITLSMIAAVVTVVVLLAYKKG